VTEDRRYKQPNFHPKEQTMGKINWNRVILGGLVALVMQPEKLTATPIGNSAAGLYENTSVPSGQAEGHTGQPARGFR
jgi:hypothetical protein